MLAISLWEEQYIVSSGVLRTKESCPHSSSEQNSHCFLRFRLFCNKAGPCSYPHYIFTPWIYTMVALLIYVSDSLALCPFIWQTLLLLLRKHWRCGFSVQHCFKKFQCLCALGYTSDTCTVRLLWHTLEIYSRNTTEINAAFYTCAGWSDGLWLIGPAPN